MSEPMHQRRRGPTSGDTNNNSNMSYNRNNNYNSDTNANIMESQNNERISELSEQVARLKGLTIDIGNEVKEQNALLDDMGDGFSATRDLLAGSLRRIGHMLETTGGKHMCYMVTFVVFVMVFLYWVMTHKGTDGA
jgi:blocked early in transport 1